MKRYLGIILVGAMAAYGAGCSSDGGEPQEEGPIGEGNPCEDQGGTGTVLAVHIYTNQKGDV